MQRKKRERKKRKCINLQTTTELSISNKIMFCSFQVDIEIIFLIWNPKPFFSFGFVKYSDFIVFDCSTKPKNIYQIILRNFVRTVGIHQYILILSVSISNKFRLCIFFLLIKYFNKFIIDFYLNLTFVLGKKYF